MVATAILKKMGVASQSIEHFEKTGEPFTCSNTFVGCQLRQDKKDAQILADMKSRSLEAYGILEEKYVTAEGGKEKEFCRRCYLFVPKYHMDCAQKNFEEGRDILFGVLIPNEGYGYTVCAYVTRILDEPDPYAEHGYIQVACKDSGLVRTA